MERTTVTPDQEPDGGGCMRREGDARNQDGAPRRNRTFNLL